MAGVPGALGHRACRISLLPGMASASSVPDAMDAGWLGGVEVLRAPLYVPAQVTGKRRILYEFSFGAITGGPISSEGLPVPLV
jgi:hypothetical protein